VQPSAVEVTQSGEKVFQMSIQTGAFSYRTYRFPFTLDAVRRNGTANTFQVAGIYPNPAQTIATVAFTIAEAGPVTIDLVDIMGRLVQSMTEKLSEAGKYSADLDIHDLPAGTYYCR